MAVLRLDKILADTGRWSRKEAGKLIRSGCVSANNRPARHPNEKFETDTLTLSVSGECILHEAYTYLMLHKPAGLLSATQDSRQKTVLDLLTPELQRRNLSPVGRLDKDSTGLLLLTNHGELAHRLLSPKYHESKVYLVRTQGQVDHADREAFAAGLTLADGEVCRPADLQILEGRPGWCLVTLTEGKYHQVKRMLAARGKPVLSLQRISMGSLQLDPSLHVGEYRPLTPEETKNLLKSVHLEQSGG